jgi:hypothetical protein
MRHALIWYGASGNQWRCALDSRQSNKAYNGKLLAPSCQAQAVLKGLRQRYADRPISQIPGLHGGHQGGDPDGHLFGRCGCNRASMCHMHRPVSDVRSWTFLRDICLHTSAYVPHALHLCSSPCTSLPVQVLYTEGESVHLMDEATYEQLQVGALKCCTVLHNAMLQGHGGEERTGLHSHGLLWAWAGARAGARACTERGSPSRLPVNCVR